MKISLKKNLAILTLFLTLMVTAKSLKGQNVEVLGVTAIAETMEEGQKLTALSIEYNEPFEAGEAVRSSFSVEGREVSRVYVNQTGNKGVVDTEGKFIIVELATSNVPGSSLGSTLYFGRMNNVETRINHRLAINPLITQVSDLTAVSGNVAPGKRLYVNKEVNLLADEFDAFSYTDPVSGVAVNYRLFVPDGYDVKSASLENLPLVVFLHGSGERGYNNASQLLANRSALEWMTPEAQAEHPCFVLAPQNPDVTRGWAANIGTASSPNWATTEHLEAAKKIIDQTLETYNIDASRIYGTGLSQGSKGTMRLSINYPGLYAAQVNVAGCDVYTDEEVARIAHKPIWHLIAVDDGTNPSANVRKLMEQLELGGATVVHDIEEEGWNGWLRGKEAEKLAVRLRAKAEEAGANVLHTEYISATVVPVTHWSWMASYSNANVRDWLFDQVNPVPYNPDLPNLNQ